MTSPLEVTIREGAVTLGAVPVVLEVGSTNVLAIGLRPAHTLPDADGDQITLELGHRADQGEHQPAVRRGGIDRLRQAHELHPAGGPLGEGPVKLWYRPERAVETNDSDDVYPATADVLEEPSPSGTAGEVGRGCLVDIFGYRVAAANGPLAEREELGLGVLFAVPGRYAGVEGGVQELSSASPQHKGIGPPVGRR